MNNSITICGSMTFFQEMSTAKSLLEEHGFTVLTPVPLVSEAWFAETYSYEELIRMKPEFMLNHFKRIEQTDSILVMNYEKKGIPGYFGSNSLMEIGLAFFLNKKLYFLFPVTSSHPHYEEVAALEKTCLEGDLSNLWKNQK